LGHLRAARRDVAEVGSEGGRKFLRADFCADDLEVNEQPLFVLDNLGLRRGDAEVLRRTASGVLYEQAESEWFAGLYFIGKPYRPAELAAKVRSILDERATRLAAARAS